MKTLRTAALTLFFLLVLSALASSDGCFFWERGADLMEPEQVAVLHLKDGTETLVLRVKYRGQATEFAWVVPVPSVPEVDVVERDERTYVKSLFGELSMHTQRREEWIARPPSRGGEESGMTLGASRVDVVERKTVGVYDIAVLEAQSADALLEWLRENGFLYPADRMDVLEHYIDRDWVFVATRIAPDELTEQVALDLRTGDLQPLLLRFQSEAMVYPLRMSSLNAGEVEVLIYTLAGSPAVPDAGPRADEIPLEHTVCAYKQLGTRQTDPASGTYKPVGRGKLPLTREALGLGEEELFVGKYRLTYRPEELTGDLAFAVFDPVGYWRAVRDTASAVGQRAMAGWVLSHHDPSILEELAASEVPEDRVAAAYSGAADPDLLSRLAGDDAADVRWMVAANRKSPPELLTALASDRDRIVHEALLGNPSTLPDALTTMAADGRRWFLHRLASHPSMHDDIWCLLTESSDSEVRSMVARHDKAPADVVERLSRDEHRWVRRSVARRRDLSTEMKLRLAEDNHKEVRAAMAQSCGEGDEDIMWTLADDREWSVRELVARNHSVPVGLLEKLALDPHFRVRHEVARNGRTPDDVLLHLARDESAEVRRAVGFMRETRDRRGTPADILILLARDDDDAVRRAVAGNPYTPPEVLQSLATDPADEVRVQVGRNRRSDGSLLVLLSKDPLSSVRRAVASNRSVSVELLSHLARDESWEVRRRVAVNRVAPDDLLLTLAADVDESVREAARGTLYDRGYERAHVDALIDASP